MLKATKFVHEEQAQRSLLVPKDEVIAMMRRVLEAIMRGLEKLPDSAGAKCNPQDPSRAIRILSAEAASIIQACKEAIDAL